MDIAALTSDAKALAAHLASQSHNECSDPWYSCPLSAGGCADETQHRCTCTAPLHHQAARLLNLMADCLSPVSVGPYVRPPVCPHCGGDEPRAVGPDMPGAPTWLCLHNWHHDDR